MQRDPAATTSRRKRTPYRIEGIEGTGKVGGDKLYAAPGATNAAKKPVRQTAGLKTVEGWIAAAKELPRKPTR